MNQSNGLPHHGHDQTSQGDSLGIGKSAIPEASALVEQACLYFAGAMSEGERHAFETMLVAAPAALRDDVRRLSSAVLALAGLGDACEPPPGLREKVLDAVSQQSDGASSAQAPQTRSHHKPQIWRNWDSSAGGAKLADHAMGAGDSGGIPGLYTLFSAEGAWEETGVDGVQVRRLFVDRPNNRMTAMFRMAPGTDYPEHLHEGFEECYVLDGDLHVEFDKRDALVMRRGDYQRAESGSEHGRQWTEGGCVLLVSTSMSDEML